MPLSLLSLARRPPINTGDNPYRRPTDTTHPEQQIEIEIGRLKKEMTVSLEQVQQAILLAQHGNGGVGCVRGVNDEGDNCVRAG